jgi:hypothetical protein
MATRATRLTEGDLGSGDVVISADAIIVESLAVANEFYNPAWVEFEDSEGTLILALMIYPWYTQTVEGPFLANKGMTIRELDSYVTFTVFHSYGV